MGGYYIYMNGIYISLRQDKQIDCNKLCEKIQALIYQQLSQATSELVLCITVQNITNNDTNMIPKLTHEKP